MNADDDRELNPTYGAGERIVTAFGDPGAVLAETPYPRIYALQLDVGEVQCLSVDMFEREPTV
jgi:hypothetical protein